MLPIMSKDELSCRDTATPEDTAFDNIVCALTEILNGKEFLCIRTEFFNEHCGICFFNFTINAI